MLIFTIIAKFFFVPETVQAAEWSISAISYDSKSKSVSSQLSAVTGVFFKDDGLTMYVIGGDNPVNVAQYTLSTAWDVSTASYASKQYTASNDSIYWGEGIFFKSDGSVLYVLSSYTDKVHQIALSTPWDISTASYSNVSSTIASQDTEPADIFFKSDGTKMYLAGNAGDRIWQYSLSSAWDITSLSYDSVSLTMGSYISGNGSTSGVFLKDDGTKIYTVDSSNDKISQFTLNTPWSLTSVSWDNVDFSVASQSGVPSGIFIKTDGGKLYLTEYTNKTVFQYSLADTTAPTVSSYLPVDNSIDVDVDGTYRITFNEAVSTSTGNIVLKKSSDSSTVETIDITSTKISRYSTTAFTIDPSTTLEAETGYYFTVDSGAITDTIDNVYTGISATTTYNFTSENAAAIGTLPPSSITGTTATFNGEIYNVKTASPSRRGFVYDTVAPDASSWALLGDELSVTSVGSPALSNLSTSTVVFIDSTTDQMRTYGFSGTTWSQTGNSLSVSTVGTPALAGLSTSSAAFIDDTNDSLRTYGFSGTTWSQTGSSLAISTVASPALAALTATSIAFIDGTNDSLRTYGFDGSTWSQTGSSLAISTVGVPALAALTTTTIAFIDSTNDSLRTYSFNGSTWSQVGSSLAVSSVGTPSIAAMTTTTISYFDTTNQQLRTYRFNGSTWAQVGNSALASSASTAAFAAMTSSTVGFIDSANDKLRAYGFGFGNVATSTTGFDYSIDTSGSFSTGAFTESLTGLSAATTYYVRAFAQNSYGYVYGNQINFTTLSDTTAPTITSVSSDKTNGAYKVGEVIDVDVTFSEAVTSAGNVTITLETGDTDRTCTFTVSSATTGSCNYTVLSGDISSDLTVSSVSGTITDAATNAMSDFTPATNLAANKALVIITTSPTITRTGNATATFTVGGSYTDAGATAVDAIGNSLTSSIVSVNPISNTVAGTYTITYNVTDSAGNTATEVTRVVTVNAASSGSVVSPPAVGSGQSSVTVPMGESRHIGAVDSTGVNVLTYINSPTVFDAVVSNFNNVVQQTHTIKIVDFDLLTSTLTIEIRSEPQNIKMSFNDRAPVDLDRDGTDDIQVVFSGINRNRAEFTLVSLLSSSNTALPVSTEDVPVQTYSFPRDLSLGVSGEDVRTLQKFLNNFGFMISSSGHGSAGMETAYFGVSTRNALIKYQKKYGIQPAFGYFGATTRKHISAHGVKDFVATISPQKELTVVAPDITFSRDLKFGMSGEDVKVLQKSLNKNGFFVPETGYFGKATVLALSQFQKSKQLPAFGYFGKLTKQYFIQ